MSHENASLSVLATKIHLPIDEILQQTVGYLTGSLVPEVSIDEEMLVSQAVEIAARALRDNYRRVFFTRPLSKATRAAARDMALAPPRTSPIAIRSNTNGPLPDPPTLSPKQKAALKQLALETILPRGVPYLLTLCPGLAEAYLPSLTGRLALTGLGSDAQSPRTVVTTDNIYFDTGAHIPIMSDDLVTGEFRRYLRTEENAPYLLHNGSKVQVSASLRFSNGQIAMAFVMLVVPLDRMPNRFSGVLLGQRTFMDRLQVEMIPRTLLAAREQNIPDEFWGDLLIKAYMDLDGILHQF
ncbi:MAG: uracil DNA glycosylase [Geoglossum umbratile]|nr:MAG: uracil DNA glycosylase [Geoglossum umbratile]